MFGSSSTTSSRASGAGRGPGPLIWGPVTAPPVGRADAVVMTPSVGLTPAAVLDATCEQPGCGVSAAPWSRSPDLGGRAGGGHGAAAPPVPDGVVLRPAQTPAAAEVGAD